MRPNPSETADLVTFIEKILDEKLHFLCSIRSRKNCIFFQFPFSYILKQYIFDLCTILWIRGFRLELSFTSQSESYSVPDMDYFVPIAVFEDRVTKTDSKCFNRTFWPFFWSILFLYAPAHNAWLFKSLSSSQMHLYIVLKSPVSL